MRIHCLGTTGYHPSPNRHTACYYLPDIDLLLDAGTGLFHLVPLLKANRHSELNIVLSHAHLDHVIGLTFLLDVIASTELRRVAIYGQSEKLAAVRNHLFHPILFPVKPDFEFIDLSEEKDRQRIGEFELEYFPLDHPGGSIGMVIHSNGKRIAYLTDTTPRVHQTVMCRLNNLDLLMHECYFLDSQVELALTTGHSWLSAVTQLVNQIKPQKTMLIHVNPLAESLGDSFEINSYQKELNMSWAVDGLEIQVP